MVTTSPVRQNPRNISDNSSHPTRSCADAAESSLVHQRRESCSQPPNDFTDTDTDNQMDSNTADFTVVGNKKRRRVNSPMLTQSRVRRITLDTVKARKIVGSSNTCTLKAAKELTKKRFFCVSNMSTGTSSEELKSWIESCNITVNSIFSAKTKFTDTTSFRVRINAGDADKFMEDSIWGPGIIIRDWVFKEKQRSNS